MAYKRISPQPIVEGGTGTQNFNGGELLVGNGIAPLSTTLTPTVDSITINNAPVNPTDGTNKAYVDSIVAGLDFVMSVYAATTANLTALYLNGAAGVGATLTNTGSLAVFTVDGETPPLNSRILVKNQTSTFQNGIYTLTTVGSGSVAWVLTRATDYDTSAQITPGDIVPVNNGTVNGTTFWIQTATVTTIGTDPIIFVQFFGGGAEMFITDSGSASVASGTITIDGGNNITTSGAGSTVTIAVTGTTDHDLLLGNSSGSINSLANGTTGQVLLANTGIDPSWGSVASAGAVTSVSGGNNVTITGTSTAPIVNVSGTINHSVQVGNATNSLTSLSVGATNTVLLGTTGADPSFGVVPNAALANSSVTLSNGNNITVTGSPLSLGGTATIAVTGTTNHDVLLGNTSGSISSLTNGTTGQVLLANTGADPSWGSVSTAGAVTSVSGGNNITVTGTSTAPIVNVSGTTNHALQVGNAGASLTSLSVGATNTVLLGNTGADPSFGTVANAALTNSSVTINSGNNITVTGSPLSLGGTASVAVTGTTNHSVLLGNSTGSINSLTNGTTGQVLLATTGADPSWGLVTGFVTSVAGGNNITITGTSSIPIVNVSGTTNHALQIGNSTGSLTSVGVGATNTVLLGNTGADPSFGTVSNAALTNSTITLSSGSNITVTGSPVALGGTASFALSGTSNHSVQIGNASGSLTSISVGITNTALLGSTSADPFFGTIPNATLANSSVTINSGNNITVTGGGPLNLGGVASLNLTGTTNHAVQIGNGTGSLTSLAVGTNGQVLIGATTADPAFALLTSTGGTIIFTTGANSLNLEAVSSGGMGRIFAFMGA